MQYAAGSWLGTEEGKVVSGSALLHQTKVQQFFVSCRCLWLGLKRLTNSCSVWSTVHYFACLLHYNATGSDIQACCGVGAGIPYCYCWSPTCCLCRRVAVCEGHAHMAPHLLW